jgi:HK97 family phage major capsid protein
MLMLKSRELRTKRAQLIADVRKELTGDITAEIRAKVEGMEKDIEKLDADITLYEKQETRERELATATDPVIDPAQDETAKSEARKKQIEVEARKYSDAFYAYLRDGMEGLDAEQRATLKKGMVAGEKPEQRAQTITTTAGGYLVPQGFMAELERAQKAFGGVRATSRVIVTGGGNPLPWPTMDDTSNSGEDSTINTNASGQDIVFGQQTLNAYKMDSGLVLVPTELFEDSGINLDAELGSILGERIGRRQNNKYTVGSGSSTFQGAVVGASAGITFALATAIAADEIFDLFHSTDPAYRTSPKFAWMLNDSTLKALRKLKDSQGHYLWQASLQEASPDTLLNKPVVINQDMASIATTNKSMLVGDFSKFIIRDVRGIVVRRLNELFAQADQVGFLAWYRGDSRVVSASAKALVVGVHP